MKKIREQTIPGVGMSEWWNIGEGYTALVKTHPGRSIIHVIVKAGHSAAQKEDAQPEHWKRTQTVDVTEEVVAKAAIQGLAELVPGGTSLTSDQSPCKQVECLEENVDAVLHQLEMAINSATF